MNNSKRNLELDNFIAEWTLIFIRVNNTGTKLFPMVQIFKYFKKKKDPGTGEPATCIHIQIYTFGPESCINK